MECKCCTCPLKKGGIENLKEKTKEDFNSMLKTFFDEHPYVESIFISDRDSCFSQSMFVYKDHYQNIVVNLK